MAFGKKHLMYPILKIQSDILGILHWKPNRIKEDQIYQIMKTWSSRLTDTSNYWLNATNKEDEGFFIEAVKLYLKDASQCLNYNSLPRAALSCSCAANCLAKTGNMTYANMLYLEAAIIYEANADSISEKSLRESLWSLEEAYEHCLLAKKFDKARGIYDKYISFVARINPLFGLKDIVQNSGLKEVNRQLIESDNDITEKDAVSMPAELTKAVKDFLQISKSINSISWRQTKLAHKSAVIAPYGENISEKGYEKNSAS